MLFDNVRFLEIIHSLDQIFTDRDKYSALYKLQGDEAEEEIKKYGCFKNEAALGNKSAREWLIRQYSIMMKQLYELTDETIQTFIDFEHLDSNHVQILFEILLEIQDISEWIMKYQLPVRITEAHIRDICRKEAGRIRAYFDISRKIRILSIIAYSREYGQDIIDTLQHHNINEVAFIDRNYVYLVHRGAKYYLEFLKFSDSGVCENIIKKTTANSPVSFDRSNISVVTNKNNANRVTGAGYDLTPGEGDFRYNERIFNLPDIRLEQLRDMYRTMDSCIFDLLVLNQRGRGCLLCTGADMGVGKSTFLNACIEKIPDEWGIGILDSNDELQSRLKYDWKNIYTLISNPKRSMAQCFELLLKSVRDVVYIGEITKPDEVAELINAFLRLNCGGGGTHHTITPYEVVTNLRNLAMRSEMYNRADIAEADIARGLDLIVHLARHKYEKGRIIVESILEVEYLEDAQDLHIITDGNKEDKLSNLLVLAQMALTKYISGRCYRYNKILEYSYEEDRWILNHLPSERYFRKLSRYVTEKDIKEFAACWTK